MLMLGASYWELQCKFRVVATCAGLGSLSKSYRHAKAGHCPFGVLDLERLRESLQPKLRQATYVEEPLEEARAG